MNVYLIASFVLLLVMLALVLRPFVLATEPVVDSGAADLSDPGAKARSVAKVERVTRAASAPAATGAASESVAAVDAPATTAAPAAPPVLGSGSDDVRASVEAAIAARKAALKATKRCTACAAVVEDGDAFCRSCGTKVTA